MKLGYYWTFMSKMGKFFWSSALLQIKRIILMIISSLYNAFTFWSNPSKSVNIKAYGKLQFSILKLKTIPPLDPIKEMYTFLN